MQFFQWCLVQHLDWSDGTELDAVLVTYLNELYYDGEAPSDGTLMVAALKFFVPEVSRLGMAGLPRSHRATRGWERLAPSLQRLPIPRVVLGAILGFLLFRRHVWTAVKLYFQYRTYLRPGVCDRLETWQLVAPLPAAGPEYQHWGVIVNPVELGIPGKTQTWDDAVIWDTDPWMGEMFALLLQHRPPGGGLWPETSSQTLDRFYDAVRWLGLEALQPCRYGLRHGGASDDLLTQRRCLAQVKKRGHWRTEASLRRYGKETRILAEVRKVAPSVIAYGAQVLENLKELFFGLLPVPAPPSQGSAGGAPRRR